VLVDGGKMIPEVGVQGWIRTGINTSAKGIGITPLNIEGNGEIIEINNSRSRGSCYILEELDTSVMTLSFNNLNRFETIICEEIKQLSKRDMSFINCKKSWIVLSDQIFHMSS